MTPNRWQQVEDLFHRATELAPPDRSAFLDANCPDAESRRDVESLLAHDAAAGEVIQDAVALEASGMVGEAAPGWLVGRRIGPYRVTGIIGEGGMGAVYAAVRDDDQYRQEVAIKIVRLGSETSRLLQRFRAERQILAALEHPYIARLLDGGTTPDGLPYLVMERVVGEPITRYARAHELSIPRRLDLFAKVCEAVQYAHAQLVVHRDIKPDNIAVTADGTPKLLDFGIARLLSPDDATSDRPTMSGELMTPEYASPEQARGHVATTATDVYSLGAVLYELLTGRSPRRLSKAGTPAEWLASIDSFEPDAPSAVADRSVASVRSLRGDLDNIVLMALRREPERRYRSVEQFAQDIRRHLDGRPVTATANSRVYRSRKFIQRNAWAVTALAAVIASLVGGVLVASRSAARAERRFAQVRQLAGSVLFEIYDGVEPLAGSTAARQLIVKHSVEYLDSLSAEASGDPSLLDELAGAYRRIGDVLGNEYGGNLGDARGALDAYRRGIGLARSATALRPGTAKYEATLGELLFALGRRQFDSSELDAARRSNEEALALLERATAQDATNDTAFESLGQAYTFLGAYTGRTGDPIKARELLTKGIAVDSRLASRSPTPGHRDLLASSWADLGTFLNYRNDLGAARDAFQHAIDIREVIVRDFPEQAASKRGLMINYANFADSLSNACFAPKLDTDAVRPYYEKTLAIAEALAAADRKNSTAQIDLAQSLLRFGCLEEVTGHVAEAVMRVERARTITAPAAQATDSARSTRILHMVVLQRLGKNLLSAGRVRDAVDRYREAYLIARDMVRKEPGGLEASGRLAGTAGFLADALGRAGDRKGLDVLTTESGPAILQLKPSSVAPQTRAYPATALFRFGEAYAALHDHRSECRWIDLSDHAWKELQAASSIPPEQAGAYADTQKALASCRASSSQPPAL